MKADLLRATGARELRWLRPISVLIGCGSLCLIPFSGLLAEKMASLALVSLSAAVLLAVAEGLRKPAGPGAPAGSPGTRREWQGATALAGLGAGLTMQTWFRPGAVIAAGDTTVPGTAWLGRLFDTWVPSGSNLGGPGSLELRLPWAAALAVVTGLGGTPGLAQRVFLSALLTGASLAMLLLLRSLQFGPWAAAAGAILYVFNGYVLAVVGFNDVYLATMLLLPLYPAVLLLVARRRLRGRVGAIVLASTAPLLGLTYQNPPLTGMLLGVLVLSPLLAGWLWGRGALLRGTAMMVLGTLLLLTISAYWIVPASRVIGTVDSGRLATISSWAWTERRATLGNGFTLNNAWGWDFAAYAPYSPPYRRLPLAALVFVLPVLGFAALALPIGRSVPRTMLRLVAVAGAISLFLVLLSTGTNNPGSAIFLWLYRLPYGWLLREPGRFLMAAGLTDSVLAACTLGQLPGLAARFPLSRPRRQQLAACLGALAVGLALVSAYPLITGAVVWRTGPGAPPQLVTRPSYWDGMAAYINAVPGDDRVVVLPPDDFYQMGYRWGFYGSDGFIQEMFTHGALVPNGDGYTPASAQLRGVVSSISAAILASDWTVVDRLLDAVHATYLLVRSDLDTNLADRHVVPAGALNSALDSDPGLYTAYEDGPLRLYGRNMVRPLLATTNLVATEIGHSPDLRVLARLPPGTDIIDSAPRPGLPMVAAVPPVTSWVPSSTSVSITVPTPPGYTYRLVSVGADGKVGEQDPATLSAEATAQKAGGSPAQRPPQPGPTRVARPPVSAPPLPATPASTRPGAMSVVAEATATGFLTRILIATGPNLLGAGPLAPRPGEPGNCDNRSGAGPGLGLFASVIADGPNGASALRLKALLDTACIQRPLATTSGPVLIHMDVRNTQGSVPRVCLWEEALRKCALTPDPPAERTWRHFSALATPDLGAGPLDLFLYADNDARGLPTVNDYANVTIVPMPAAPPIALLGKPLVPGGSERLVTLRQTDSPGWATPVGARRVLVDGLMPGFLLAPGAAPPARIQYLPDRDITAAFWVSLTASALVACMVPVLWLRGRR